MRNSAHAATVNVSNDSQLDSALAAASPGDVIIWANGSYYRQMAELHGYDKRY